MLLQASIKPAVTAHAKGWHLFASLNNAFGQRFNHIALRKEVTHYKELLRCPNMRTGHLNHKDLFCNIYLSLVYSSQIPARLNTEQQSPSNLCTVCTWGLKCKQYLGRSKKEENKVASGFGLHLHLHKEPLAFWPFYAEALVPIWCH